MPELPEMASYRQHLETYCLGQTIVQAEIGRTKSLNMPPGVFEQAVQGARLTGCDRAGKHLVLHLSTGLHLLNHLMLGGAIFYGTDEEAPKRTFQVILRLSGGKSLYWYGLRLGWLHLVNHAELAARTADLGLDPLDAAFTPAHLHALLEGRRGALKPLLVDQEHFPGVGNCYADEICWTARVHPLRTAGSLSTAEQAGLWAAMKTVLAAAAHLGGYTETPFHRHDTFTGGYLPRLQVYDRKGEPCRRCGTSVAFDRAAGRKVFYCPICQPEEPAHTGAAPHAAPESAVTRRTGTEGR
jgi:formamidopyrimidine-DNA glycosylase